MKSAYYANSRTNKNSRSMNETPPAPLPQTPPVPSPQAVEGTYLALEPRALGCPAPTGCGRQTEPARPAAGRPRLHRHHPEPTPDRGSATIWTAALTGLVCLLAITTMTATGIRATRHQAQLAADMAALTAATRHTWGHPTPCPHARRAARHTGAHLTTCTLTPSPHTFGTIAEVTVTIPLTTPRWLPPLAVSATARAGPAS